MNPENYRDSDYETVCDFLIELNREDRRHIHWNWARFEWMYEHPEFDKSLRSSIGLWRDGNAVVGAAIYDMYFGEAFCAALPAYEALYPEILGYAWNELKDDAGLGIAVCDGDERKAAAVLAAGFAPAEQSETVLRLDLDVLRETQLPGGFTIAEPDLVRDAEALQWLFWQGFDHGEDYAEFARTEQAVPQPRKHYDPRLGLAAVNPAGDYAAFCGLWYSPKTDYAYVEPVCTVPAFRGRGIASALLTQGLRRAKAFGAKEAYVISDLDFYRKLGFEDAYRYTFYWK